MQNNMAVMKKTYWTVIAIALLPLMLSFSFAAKTSQRTILSQKVIQPKSSSDAKKKSDFRMRISQEPRARIVLQGWQYKYSARQKSDQDTWLWLQKQDHFLNHKIAKPTKPWKNFSFILKKPENYEPPDFPVKPGLDLWLRFPMPIFDTNERWPALFMDAGIKNEFQVYAQVRKEWRILAHKPSQLFLIWNHIITLDHIQPGQFIYLRFAYKKPQKPFYGQIQIGPENDFINYIWKNGLVSFLASVFILLLGIISIIVFIGRRSKRVLPFFSFGLFALALGLYLFSKSPIRLFFYDKTGIWFTFELLSLYLLPFSITLFFKHTFGKGYKKFTSILWQFYLTSFIMVLIADLFLAIPLIFFLKYFQVILLIGLIYLMTYSVLLSIKSHRNRTEARIFASGFFLLGIVGIYNTLGAMNIIQTPLSTVYLGAILFVVSLVAILIYRIVSTYKNMQAYARELGKKNKDLHKAQKDLSLYNEHLEDMVEQRTIELKTKNEQMMRDLRMAQRVQQNIIPNDSRFPKSENLEFGSMYLSMDDVGGDLYDIIRIGKNSYAFLIADVSGHGVPAALITTMAKVAYHSHTKIDRAPGEINDRVHKDLFRFIGDLDYYLTAYLGIIDLETGIFKYSNAGHHPALIYRPAEKKIIPLDSEGILIGAVENGIFSTRSVVLADHDRLIMYTDGIIEARNPEGELYDFDRLKNYIYANGHLATKEFVDNMIQNVDAFCAGRKPDDDRAVLCIDYFKDKGKISASGTVTKSDNY